MFISMFKLLPYIMFYGIIALIIFLIIKDKYQNQHAILKTHPLLGRLRYIFEMVGPEFRQYWFSGDKEGKPVDRDTQETIAKAGKYANTVIGFGSKKDFSLTSFYLTNSMFPLNIDELSVDNKSPIETYTYQILGETVTKRKEKRNQVQVKPWHLSDENQVVIGPEREHPFHVKGLLGVSAMSFGALSKSAVKALAQGVAISGGSYMNTGEGSISRYHLSRVYEVIDYSIEPFDRLSEKLINYIKEHPNCSNFEMEDRFGKRIMSHLDKLVEQGVLKDKRADLIFQVGSGLFGARKDGKYSEEVFLENAMKPEVKAIELKLAQGAKVRGGKLPKEKITEEIAKIRGVDMGHDVESPNRFPLFSDMDGLFEWVTHWQSITGKPVGIKVVAGDNDSFESLAKYMKETGKEPDFISIDGAEGGTGATYQEMADSLGMPIYSGIHILDQTLRKYGVRKDVKIIASGMLATADKMAIALSLGADLIYVARAAMNTVGCINAGKCHTNHCPVGVTSHLPHLEAGLVVEEKRFRTANYLRTMREGLFMLGASCGIDSPSKFSTEHIALRESNNDVSKYRNNVARHINNSSSAQITRIEDVKNSKDKEKEKELVRS
ncbi:FMN-binding glutamate synthase family protein [Virgibacillus sp. MSJ-26]|uniref:FMN-binding glutamate synthase family protein n=1 Tax=Virgibacillus sp. MSJ-26 TaxID=2841522 RepID=UPI001C0FA539|nr:FMN-binding glutamate synthase family protein [Virgibacillus sp. MSJ-26]MBU5467546.1 FMN-binding glutamate synthase family protein [Virgibacillus sp. MSJ-26]